MSENQPATLVREAYACFELLMEAGEETRTRELTQLRETRPELHARVLALLEADERAQSRGMVAGALLRGIQAETVGLSKGLDVGLYRLEQRLGAGGMGEVWLAQRTDGAKATAVALKFLHAHLMNSAQRSRFTREGRILGQLEHPNIARLLDAGTDSAGRLYLALEYIEGRGIDYWCDMKQLDLKARLHLFLKVCGAVSHAHAHLVVHRDLKPSNILVGAGGELKLLDFGIAKLIEAEGETAAETELTRLGGRVLTPEYAAPEQVLGRPITTATDVYALGVVLYALLCGRRPYGNRDATGPELERAAVETEAIPASRAASADPENAATVARLRATTPRRLRAALRGDLDTILARAMKKAPAERYPSALALADDLRRHLDGLPVLARPDSFRYRARKYLRRHRVAAGAAVAVFLALALGLSAALWQARRAERESALAQEEAVRVKRVKDFFVSIFVDTDPLRRRSDAPLSLMEAYDRALKRVDTEVSEDPSLQADLLDDFGEIKAGQGGLEEAYALFQRALPLKERTRAADDPAIANTLVNLGTIQAYLGHVQAGRPWLERAIAILEQHADSEGDALANARNGLASVYNDAGDDLAAAALIAKAAAWYRAHPEPQSMRLGITLGNLGITMASAGRYDEARAALQECVSVQSASGGPDSINVEHCLLPLTNIALADGDPETAAATAVRALAIARKNYSADNAWIARALAALGQARLAQEQWAEGEHDLGEAAAMYERLHADGMIIGPRVQLAGSLNRRALPAEALTLADDTLQLCRKIAPAAADDCLMLSVARADALVALGRNDEALATASAVVALASGVGGSRARQRGDALSVRAATRAAMNQLPAAAADQAEALRLYDLAGGRSARREARWTLARYLAARSAEADNGEALAEAHRLLKDTAPPEADEAATARYRLALATLARGEGRSEEATKLAREAEAMLARHLPARALDYQDCQRFLQAELPPRNS